MSKKASIKLSQRWKNVALAAQHVAAMFGATTLVPLLTGLHPAVALFAAGFGTLIFHLFTERKVPVFLGSSFAFIPGLIVVGEQYGLSYAQGGIMVAGLLYIIMSLLVEKVIGVEKIDEIIPRHVIGAMITIIGVGLIPVAIDMASAHWLVAVITLATALSIMFFGKGFLSQLSIMIGIIVGYLVSIPLGISDISAIQQASWIMRPEFTAPQFNLTAILIIAPVVVATFMEHIGDITASSEITGKNFVVDPGLHKTLRGDGVATFFAGAIGGPANTTYGENTGLLAITKNYDPSVLRMAAVFAIGLAFVGKVSGLLASIPVPVLGGISLLLFGMIAKIGIFAIKDDNSWNSWRKTVVIIGMLFLGLGSVEIWQFSGVSLAAIFGVLANLGLKKIDTGVIE